MKKELASFDKLKADITLFVAPTFGLQVHDPESSAQAIEVAKKIKAYLKQVEDKRRELVDPLREQINLINNYVKTITAPLSQAEGHVRSELDAFATKQEEIRQAEMRRIEQERLEDERKAREDRERAEAEFMAKQEEEAALIAAGNSLFGTGEEEIEEVNQEVDKRQEREWAEKQAELDRQAMIRSIEHKQKVYDANLDQVRNTRKKWKCELIDINLVPREFLIVQLNEKMVLAAARGGNTKIPGVRLYQDVSVAIGANTYMPRARR